MKQIISTLFLCGLAFSLYAVQVTFRVDMSNVTISGSGVHLAGNFSSNGYPGWNPGGIAMTDVNADNIYEVTLELTAGQTYPYKFINGNSWGQDENAIPGACNVGGNRQVVVGSSTTLLPVVCFNECSFCSSNPQFRQVTFKLDMQNETVSPNGVHLAGTFHYTPAPHTGPEWVANGIAMTDADADGVYEVTLTLAEGYGYQYKFINNNDWSSGGEGNISAPCGNGWNRTLTVPTAPSTTLNEVCFNSCSDCIPAPDPIEVTFKLDMQNSTVSPNGVHLAGSFGANGYDEWNPGGIAMTDADADGVYEVTLTLTEGQSYEYKFVNGNDWPFAESFSGACVNGSTNRFFTVGSSNTTLPEVCFNSCVDCTPIYDVTFRVNMNYLSVSPNGVHLAGSFGSAGYDEWNPGGIAMTDANSDGIYEATLSLPSGVTYQYKFVNGNDWSQQPENVPAECGIFDGGGNYNRTINPSQDGALDIICFGACADCIGGCLDGNACNYNALANADNGSCTYASLAYFIDADGDGFGTGTASLYCSNPGVGFASVAGDCNDNNANVYPNAPELCSNSIDDDCDGFVNEGCPVSAQPNDNRSAAISSNGNAFPSCSSNIGNLTGATASGECFTSAPVGAGQDVWYRFVAQTNGVRIQATSTVNDIVIELQNSTGTSMLQFENETSVGNEVLVANNLVPGQTYFVAIRNFNTNAVGSFTYCIQHLTASQPNNGTSFNNLCGFIKSKWNGASLYSVTFDDGVNTPISASGTSTQIPFSWLSGVRYNTTYNVTFTTTFNINDAAGNPTTVVVNSAPYVVNILQHQLVELRSLDRCPNTRLLNAYVTTTATICGSNGFQWEVELVDENNIPVGIEGPVTVNTTSRYLKVNQIPGVQAGQRYRVRVRPTFSYGTGVYAPGYQYLCITGAANMEMIEEFMAPAQRSLTTEVEAGMNVYPNPNRGDVFTVRAGGLVSEQVFVRIMDIAGREVYSSGFAVDGVLNATLQMASVLQSGIYMIELTDGAERFVQRMIVE